MSIDFKIMSRVELEALAQRAIIDAVGREPFRAYTAVVQGHESVAQVAIDLGVSRRTIYNWLRRVHEYLRQIRQLVPS